MTREERATAFISKYSGRKLMFVLSLMSGRPEDCVKDVQRGRVPEDDARRMLDDADAYGFYTRLTRLMLANVGLLSD